ncbi:MAG: hypothetical protein NTW60_03995 [Candidatus Wolfebacteria bacterium]|nr:hypothetical protein [Candidatus Wolfebacteria bacterium]
MIMGKVIDLEIIEEIYKWRDEIILNITREDVDVYLWLRNEYEKGNVIDNTVFQFIFRSYYRLDSAGLSDEQKTEYFKLLASGNIDLKVILNRLYALPTLRGGNTIQFSFATKLLHTIDNDKPIFDSEVSTVIHKVVSGNNKEAKIDSAKILFDYMEDLYLEFSKNKKIQEVIKKFRTRFCVDAKKITDYKILDFIIWSLGKLKRKNKTKDLKRRSSISNSQKKSNLILIDTLMESVREPMRKQMQAKLNAELKKGNPSQFLINHYKKGLGL